MIKLPIQGCERYSHTLLVENHPVPVVDDYIKLLYPHTVPTKSSKIHKIPISSQTLLFWYPPAPPPYRHPPSAAGWCRSPRARCAAPRGTERWDRREWSTTPRRRRLGPATAHLPGTRLLRLQAKRISLKWINGTYHLVMTNIAMERSTHFS